MKLSTDGLSPEQSKIETLIKDIVPPKNIKEVRSFLGMANYSARFINKDV